MAPRSISSPLLLLSAVLLSCCCGLSGAARPAPSAAAVGNVSFIRSWCAGTEYPTLCDATLFPHAAAVGTSPARLAWAALNVTLDGARNAKAAMKEMAAGGQLTPVAAEAAGDCVSMLGDAVGMLRQSVETMEEQAEEEGQATQQASRTARFRVDSVRTWASAALTDDGMCMEGFKGEAAGVREAVRSHVIGLAHLTANALGIVNAMAAQTPP
ncbi:pectinesterase inhibitor 10-like [Lolium perenne]|uniref:pectinesterase inhibitor 10-like n=1 Tax=Lolium perenne TaxID=4522 RepID=UPI0021EA8F26|nr:pectinesterase inhibitor 10-like [Lolium perenne]